MRAAGLICVCIPLALIGLRRASRASRAAAVLEGFAAFFASLRLSLEGAEGALETVLRGCLSSSRGVGFEELLKNELSRGERPADAWKRALAGVRGIDSLSARDASMLSEFGGAFQCTSMLAFRENCGVYEKICLARAAEAKEKRERDARLIGTLSVLGAALLFILLI